MPYFLQKIWNKLIDKCLSALETDGPRSRNALDTLYLLLSGILHHRFSNWTSDVALVIIGESKSEIAPFLARFFEILKKQLVSDSEDLRRLAIQLFITLITANNSIEDNFMIPHMIESGLADIFVELVLQQPSGITTRDCLAVITLLSILDDIDAKAPSESSSSDQKSNIANPFARLLRSSESGPFLKHTIALLEHDMRVALRHRGATPYLDAQVLPSNFASYVASWLRPSAYTPTAVQTDLADLSIVALSPSECFLTNPGLSFLILHLMVQYNEFFMKALFFPSTVDMAHANSTASRKLPTAIVPNLLIDFFEVSSFFLPSAEPKSLTYSRLILTTMLIIVENTELCFLIHDEKLATNLVFAGEKRKGTFPTPLPLAAFIMECCQMFLRNHLSGDLFVGSDLSWLCELFGVTLDVLHRLFCFQKKMHMRIAYPWRSVWHTLMTFLTSFSAAILAKNSLSPALLTTEVLPVIRKVLVLFNIGITFGDHFLPTSSDYDELYYEIIRCEKQFKTLIASVEELELQATTPPSDSDETTQTTPPLSPLASDLYNIKSILAHFSEKLGFFQSAHPDTPLSGPLITNMIKSNYENLRLRLQDDIDQYTKYNPAEPKEKKLLRRYAKALVQDLKLKRYTEIEAAISQRVSLRYPGGQTVTSVSPTLDSKKPK